MFRNVTIFFILFYFVPVSALELESLWAVYTPADSALPHERVSVFQPAANHGLILGTGAAFVDSPGGGLAYIPADNSPWLVLNSSKAPLPGNDITGVVSDRAGGWWISAQVLPDGGGLVRLRADGIWQHYDTLKYGFFSGNVETLVSDGKGGVWAGGYRNLIRINQDGTFKASGLRGILSHSIETMISDNAGGLWVGTVEDGLIHYTANGQSAKYHPHDIVRVSALAYDANGVLWIGSGRGLLYLDPLGNWHLVDRDASGLPEGPVPALATDEGGNLWVGTEAGLYLRDNQDLWQRFSTANSPLPSNRIISLYAESARSVWIGAWDYENGGGLAHLTLQDPLPNPGDKAVLIPNQSLLRNGQTLEVTIPSAPFGQDQYVGVQAPGGALFILSELNGLELYQGGPLERWKGGQLALQLSIADWIPRGYYQLYLLRVPSGMDPLANVLLWQLGVSGLLIQ